MLSNCRRALSLLGVVIILMVFSEVNHGAVTPVANPGPFHYHSGQPDDVDPATWTSSSADAGTTTAFSLWGSLTGPGVPGEYYWSIAHADDGADYEDTISGATNPYFTYKIKLKVDIEVWVSPHVVDNDTTYWTNASSNTVVGIWKNGQYQGSIDDPKEVDRKQETPDLVSASSEYDFQSVVGNASELKIEYRARATVSLRTDRAENTIHAKAATDHGTPGTPIGWVKKWDGANQVGNTVDLE